MKLLVAYEKGAKKLLKIELDNGEQKWATCSEAVFNYTKANFKQKEDAIFEMSEKAGQYNVTKISKVEGSPVTTSDTSSDTLKCEDCGVALKDSKYKKCFNCNKKSPSETARPGKNESMIVKECVLKASANAISTCMVGQIGDVDALGEMICKLYDKLLTKING